MPFSAYVLLESKELVDCLSKLCGCFIGSRYIGVSVCLINGAGMAMEVDVPCAFKGITNAQIVLLEIAFKPTIKNLA